MANEKTYRRIKNVIIVDKRFGYPKGTSYLLKNEHGDETFEMGRKIFESAFEPATNADYAVLTPEDRRIIRCVLSDHLLLLAKQVATGKMTPEQLVKTQTKVSANVGEKYKTMQEKFDYVDALNIKIEKKGW